MAEASPEHVETDIEGYLDAASRLVGVNVMPEDRALVAENLRTLASMAALVLQEPLDDQTAPAPVFRA